MTIHIDYDREENKIESILASQTKMIRTLEIIHLCCLKTLFYRKTKKKAKKEFKHRQKSIVSFPAAKFNFLKN